MSDEKASDMAWRLRQQMYGPCRVREEAAAAIIEGQQAENKRLRGEVKRLRTILRMPGPYKEVSDGEAT